MQELISIIVTIYNTEQYLEECLDSILSQTYKNLEVILVDDGSQDKSPRICDSYARKDDRIQVIHKMNEGLVSARKTGVIASHGKYAGYVDADDWIEPAMYQSLYDALKDSGADIVASGRIEEHGSRSIVVKNALEEGVYSGRRLAGLYEKMLYSGRFYEFGIHPTVWDKLFRRDLLLKNQMQVPNEIMVGEDVACTYPCMLQAQTVCLLDGCYYHYRKRRDSMLRTRDLKYYDRVFVIQDYLTQRFKATEFWEVLKPQLDYYLWDLITNGAGSLYHLNKPSELRRFYLFPFDKIPRGSRVAIYGAGNVGRAFMEQLKHGNYCKIVCWVDKDAEGKKSLARCPIHFPGILKQTEFDYVVVAIQDEQAAKKIRDALLEMGIEEAKIVWEDPYY